MKFKISVYRIKSGACQGWYDYSIWADGIMIQGISGTAFETKEKAREHGKYVLTQLSK